MAPYPTITCIPPPAQVTVVPLGQSVVPFVVVVEWSRSRPDFPIELCLLHNNASAPKHSSEFSSQPLQRSKTQPTLLAEDDSTDYRITFSGTLSIDPHDSHAFTFKYRVDQYAPWIFVDSMLGMRPGLLICQQPLEPASAIQNMIDLAPGWNVKPLHMNSETNVFELRSDQSITRGTELSTAVIGTIRAQLRYFALVRLEPYWLGPRQGEEYFHLSEDGVVLSFLTRSGHVMTMLPVNEVGDTYSVLRSDRGQIVVAAQAHHEDHLPYRVLCSIGTSVDETIDTVVTAARETLSITGSMEKFIQSAAGLTGSVDSADSFYDGITFCTWNALGQDLTEHKILAALDTLDKHDVHVSNVLIDDNWQSLGATTYDYSDPFMRGFADFGANDVGFPGGLSGLVKNIRQRHPDVLNVGVWHALFGYWAGLARNSSISRKYQTRQVEVMLMGNIPSTIEIVDPHDVDVFYNDFYEFLAASGIDFVKTDVQHMQGAVLNLVDQGTIPTAYQRAWTASHLRHFQGKAISCMSQIPQVLFHSLLQNETPRIVMRNSDDFYPEIPASHPWHVWTNAHNAVFTQHLNVLPYWDMFQTSHDFSAFHAASRCLSGGPILITDVPGEHDIGLIQQMSAQTPNGRTIALRPNIARSMAVFDQYNGDTVLRIGTTTGDTAILGIFNTTDRNISSLISPREFPPTSATTVLLRSFRTKETCWPVTLDATHNPNDLVQLHLKPSQWDILFSHQVFNISTLEIVVLGLLEKMCGPAAVVNTSIASTEDNIDVSMQVKALGKLGIWIRGLSVLHPVDVSLQGHALDPELVTKHGSPPILEVDLVRAWKKLKSSSAQVKEVEVRVKIHHGNRQL